MTADHHYLVNYGLGGFLGRYHAAGEHTRGDRVVIRSPRGVELGTILREAPDLIGPALEGAVLRPLTADDESVLADFQKLADRVVTDAQNFAEAAQLPLLMLDAEFLLEPCEAILHAVHWDECDATPVFQELSGRYGFPVKLADLTTRPVPATGCSTCGSEKSGCDSCGTGGGCSTGSCSSGSVKSAEELTAYFAGLRKQMEASSSRTRLNST